MMSVQESPKYFANRFAAGRHLAENLLDYQGKDTVIFAIPHGGVPVAIEVANRRKKSAMKLCTGA
jgi:predicted phosphoribosyltransferase